MRLLTGLAAAATLSTGLVLVGVGHAPPAAAEECLTITAVDDEDAEAVEMEGDPLASLQVRAAHEWMRDRGFGLGRGVTIGVVDSGVSPRATGITVTRRKESFESKRDPSSTDLDFQGTAVAGLVAGDPVEDQLVGIAPEADVVDIAVYDAPDAGEEQSDDSTPLESENLAAGLRTAAGLDLDIVTVALEIEDSREVRRAVRALTDDGVIVVAASGNLPPEDGRFADEFGTLGFGDDAAQEIFPAGYAAGEDPDPLVVAATSTVPEGVDPGEFVLPNSATTVAVPTAGGISYAVNGVRCSLVEPSSTWAAATVAGVLALLRSAYGNESPEQLIARMVETAAGPATSGGANSSRFLGRGVVQPLEALVRDVNPAEDGGVRRLDQPDMDNDPAAIDPPDPDLLASAREDAVWWALGTGGLIAVLLLLRPVIGRRRRETDLRT